ncbi:unnamed protein product [Rhizopus stolonifer]
MPSSHSQFIWYFATFASLYLFKHIQLDHNLWKSLSSLAMITLALLVSISRVYLGYHTVNQVIVGSLAGSFFGLFWYAIVNKLYSSKWIDFIVDSSLAKRIYLRDSRSIDNVAKWEYIQWTKAKKSS